MNSPDTRSCPAYHPPHLLEIDGLCVSYGKVAALRDVSFRASCGQRLALIGPNGAGKSTLLKAIMGLVRRDHGSVLWSGTPLAHGSREIAYVPQRSEIDWSFPATVRRIVEMGRYPHLGWWRRYGKRDVEAVDRALEAMNLTGLQTRQISALSGGQQQRTFLARALAQEAHVLLLDEPLAGLDVPAQAALTELMMGLADEGRLLIASHHELSTAATVFDHALVLSCHQRAFGPSKEVLTPGILEPVFGASVMDDLSATHNAQFQ